MSSTHVQSDAAILQMLVPGLEAEGFRVFMHPAQSFLPPFMQGYQPDAIATKGDRKIAIEVTSGPGAANRRLQDLQRMFASHTDWELRVIYAPRQQTDQAIPVSSQAVIAENLDRLLTVYDQAGAIPALLMGWSIFEAAARSLAPETLERPQTTGRLLEALASDGSITPDEADGLRQIARLRNEAAHGRLDVTVAREQIEALASVTRTLLELSGPENGRSA
jgi:hypothetical protein